MAALGAIASLALLGGVSASFAQGRPAQHGQIIEVPPGAVVLVLPGGAMSPSQPMFDTDVAFPTTLMQRVSQMMADAQRAFAEPSWVSQDRLIDAALQQMPQAGGAVSGVFVTSVSNGRGTCTQRVTYAGNGAAPEVEVSGNACDCAGLPAAAPTMPAPRTVPRTLQVKNTTPPLQVAQLGN